MGKGAISAGPAFVVVLAALLAMLGLRDRTQAAIYAYETGLVASRQRWT